MRRCHVHSTSRQDLGWVRLDPLPFDRRAAYVQSVCDVLIESRFGPGRPSQLVVHLSDRPELDPSVFYDMISGEMVPCYEMCPYGRSHYQVLEVAFRRSKEARLADGSNGSNGAHKSTATLARGSPLVGERL
ncbi:MAG: hypothetical protein WBO10_11880 [Pyrinomonadaceae bacterium]